MLFPAPLVDQLNEGTDDGGPDESARSNCVPAQYASALMGFFPGRRYNGDELRDAVYGEGSVGATDPTRYTAYLASQGVRQTAFSATDGWALVHTAVAALQRRAPVSVAIPSQWATAPADALHPVGGTHQVLLCDFDGTSLTAMNPWPEPPTNNAFYQQQPLAWWAARIVYGRGFVLERIAPMSPAPYTKNADGSLSYPNGVVLHTATAAYVVANNMTATPLQAQQYAGTRYGFTPFDDGTVLVWDGQEQRVRTDLASEIIFLLCHQPAPPAPPAPDPKAAHALAQVQAIAAILAH